MSKEDSKRVGVLTLYGEYNYGNRLQNYAVVQSLAKMGFKAETLVATKRNIFLYKTKRLALMILDGLFSGVIKKTKPSVSKFVNFYRFTRKNIPTRYIQTKSGVLPNSISSKYDFFVTGSDQVWNTTLGYSDQEYRNYLLEFAAPEKRYCFSPSFGISYVDERWENELANELNKFVSLNVRESAGVDLVKNLTQREDVISVIDPTLMLNKEDWLKVSKPVKNLPQKFTVDYFLGETPSDNEAYQYASKGCPKIRLLNKEDVDIYTSGPSEFIYLISKADMVCTDSFHACVFSILFEKPFVVFKRDDGTKDMFSRIETLLGLFGINATDNIGKTIKLDKDARDRVLSQERKKLVACFLK